MIGKMYVGMYLFFGFAVILLSASAGFRRELLELFTMSIGGGGFLWLFMNQQAKEYLDQVKETQAREWLDKTIGSV